MAIPTSSLRFLDLRINTSGRGDLPDNVDTRTRPTDGEVGYFIGDVGKLADKSRSGGPAALFGDENQSTPPIDIRVLDGSTVTPDDSPLSPEPSQTSSMENFLQNRRTSISFNPKIKLDSGHHQSIDEPLKKPIKIRERGRSLLQAISDEKSRAARAHSESDRTHYDTVTGRHLPKYANKEDAYEQPHIGELRHPLLPTTVDDLARECQIDLSRTSTNSIATESTNPATPDVIQKPQDETEDLSLSPTALTPPLIHPSSYEEHSTWKRQGSRRYTDRSQADFFGRAKGGSMRRAMRDASRRSTSSSNKSPLSAASSFLRSFSMSDGARGGGGGVSGRPPSPDAEGQTIGDDYVLGKQIGYGGFSVIKEVFQINESGTMRKVAVKIVRRSIHGKSEEENEQAQAEFEHEVELWRFLNHPRILPLEAVYKTDQATFCFIPLNVGGTLFDLIRSHRQGLPIHLAKRYTHQLASALRYLHKDARVVHRDVKLENCLLDTTSTPYNVRLCDFGMAEWISRDDSTSASGPPSPSINSADRPRKKNIGPSDTSTSAFAGGSLEYAAPEILRVAAASGSPERGIVSPAVDLWALGVCVYAMVVGQRPFSNRFQPRIVMAILAGDWERESLLHKGGDDLLDLTQGCLTKDPNERWDIGDVMASAWLRDEIDNAEELYDNYGGAWRL